MADKNQPNNESGKRKDSRRTFSVSKGFKEVHDVLDGLPDNEMSRFVCEAILHYHQVKNNPNWMGEQIQQIFAMQTQLQQMISGFGGGFTPPPPYPAQGMQQQPYNVPFQQVPMQQSAPMYPSYMQPGVQENVDASPAQPSPSLPPVREGEFPTAEQVVEHAMQQVANEESEPPVDASTNSSKEEVQAEGMNATSVDEPPKRRKKSGFGQALIRKSLGQTDK
ncbi:hypothetical protein JOD82_002301 [Paenibacillus sp. 1182]|uniref:hypothetical protein n=1 Tax=Paenibacillus sp. 1182 TaxID=2806565 RepID=UPI001AE985D3|nr:hypothetical protein [Paenibacillus sp. 1182]MBP1309281.1 hypothetical protein [Paenibacillus sp. 1182]